VEQPLREGGLLLGSEQEAEEGFEHASRAGEVWVLGELFHELAAGAGTDVPEQAVAPRRDEGKETVADEEHSEKFEGSFEHRFCRFDLGEDEEEEQGAQAEGDRGHDHLEQGARRRSWHRTIGDELVSHLAAMKGNPPDRAPQKTEADDGVDFNR
jgi:hypothetical protein